VIVGGGTVSKQRFGALQYPHTSYDGHDVRSQTSHHYNKWALNTARLAGHGVTLSAISSNPRPSTLPKRGPSTPPRTGAPADLLPSFLSKLSPAFIRRRNAIGIKTTPDVNHGKLA